MITFGRGPDADIALGTVRVGAGTATAQLASGGDTGPLTLVVPGEYNLLNAAAAYATGRELGLPGPAVRSALGTFTGTSRRFELVGEVGGARIYDDYAHHPTEVAATLTAARQLAGAGRVVACFQPHLFTRTRDFAADFGRVLALADQILVLGIYPAREDPIPGVTGRLVADAAAAVAGAERVSYAESVADGMEALAGLLRPGDLALTIGAGDVTRVGRELASRPAEGRR